MSLQYLDLATECVTNQLRVCVVVFDQILMQDQDTFSYWLLPQELARENISVTSLIVPTEYKNKNSNVSHSESIDSQVSVFKLPIANTEFKQPVENPFAPLSYACYKWLRNKNFDVIHFPTTGGLAYYSLLAKLEGLAFEKTILCVSLLGRHCRRMRPYNDLPSNVSDLCTDHMERESIAMADAIIFDSVEEKKWLDAHNWHYPELVCFSQTQTSWKHIHDSFKKKLLSNFNATTPLPEKRMPLVSVCIPYFSKTERLARAIASLEAQSYANFEIVLVDNGSTNPSTRQFVGQLASKFSERNWQIVYKDSCNLNVLRNAATQYAKGEYLLFMDGDNLALPHELSTLVAVGQKTQADVITCFANLFRNDQVDSTLAQSYATQLFYGNIPSAGAFSNVFGDTNALIRAESFKSLVGFNDDQNCLDEDRELYIRASIAGLKIICVPEPLFCRHMTDKTVDWVDEYTIDRPPLLSPYLETYEHPELMSCLAGQQVNLHVYQHVCHKLVAKENEIFYLRKDNDAQGKILEEEQQQEKEILKSYWQSSSWNLLSPLRNLIRTIRSLPPEKMPEVLTASDYRRASRYINNSFSWNITGPLRAAGIIARRAKELLIRLQSNNDQRNIEENSSSVAAETVKTQELDRVVSIEVKTSRQPKFKRNFSSQNPTVTAIKYKVIDDHFEKLAQSIGIEDDTYFENIVRASCSFFHLFYRWNGYPRSLRQDIEQILDLSKRVDVIRQALKVRSFLMLNSDPAIISWEQLAEPIIALGLKDFDIASVEERGLKHNVIFFLVFFGGCLKRSGDLISAKQFYKLLVGRGFKAEGFLGLADIHHLLANWKIELREYKELQIIPYDMPIPHEFIHEPMANLDSYNHDQAVTFYNEAINCQADVSFYSIHLGRCLFNAGKIHEAYDAFSRAIKIPKPNPFASIYWHLSAALRTKVSLVRQIGDFFTAEKLNERFAEIRTAKLVSAFDIARIADETIALSKEETLSVSYRIVTNGHAIDQKARILFPAKEAVRLPMMRDLGYGFKLAYENQLLVDGRGLALSQLKLFVPSIMMVFGDRALVGLPKERQYVRSDKILFTVPGYAHNYYHWLFDCLGSVILLENMVGLNDFEMAIHAPLVPWQEESMRAALTAIPEQRLTPHPLHRFVFEDVLHLPFPSRLNTPHPQVIRLLRQRLSQHKAVPKRGKRIFLSRHSLSRGRKTVNEDSIKKFLEGKGFEAVDPGELSFSEQIELFSDVEVVVAAGGAALSNLVFCPDQTRVVILSCAFHHQETYTSLANIIGQRIWVCLAGCIMRPNPYMVWSVFDQSLELKDVEIAVEEALASIP